MNFSHGKRLFDKLVIIMITEEEVAEYLVKKKFFLTALEFHQELLEERTALPPCLHTIFSNLPDPLALEDLDSYFSQGFHIQIINYV